VVLPKDRAIIVIIREELGLLLHPVMEDVR
jgi:hypothetical protein